MEEFKNFKLEFCKSLYIDKFIKHISKILNNKGKYIRRIKE